MEIIIKKDAEGNTNEVVGINNGEYFGRVSVHQISGLNMSKEPKVFGINWAGIGTVGVEEAKGYAKLIEIAIKEVELLNKK